MAQTLIHKRMRFGNKTRCACGDLNCKVINLPYEQDDIIEIYHTLHDFTAKPYHTIVRMNNGRLYCSCANGQRIL